MPNDEITPVSWQTLKDMTKAYPDIPDNRRPRCYEQCVESPECRPELDDENVKGQGPAYN